MKTAIIYKSHLGSTKKYSEWLAQEINADIFTFKQARNTDLSKYNKLVIASGTYIGHMPLKKFLMKNWHEIKNKKIIAMAVGAVPSNKPESVKSYEKIASEIRKEITYFKLPGKLGKTNANSIKKENLKQIIKELS